MKNCSCFLAVVALLLAPTVTRATSLNWTNTAGGNWATAANWSPNQVPVTGDDVIITNAGTYTVTNGPSLTLHNLTIGGTNGTQALVITSLTLTNVGQVNSNGVLYWLGGDLEGSMTVAQGGRLVQSNTLHFVYNNYGFGYTNAAFLTNNGTVISAGPIYGSGNPSTHNGGGVIYNAGVWNAVADLSCDTYNGFGTNTFINVGTLEKTASTGISTINWMFNNNGGTISNAAGAFTMGNWTNSGTVHGTAKFASGTIAGTLASDCVMTSSATVYGVLTVSSNAVLNLNGGDIEGSMIVAPGGTVFQTNTLHFAYNNYAINAANTGTLTNYGTVMWGGLLYGSGNSTTKAGGGLIHNAGTWNAVADNSMTSYNNFGTNYFINAGTLEKTAGTGTSTINWNFSTTGSIQTGSGVFNLNWSGASVLNGNASITGTFYGTLTLASNGVLNVNNAYLEGSLIVAQGSTLVLSNTTHFAYNNYALGYTNTATLTNYGTVVCSSVVYASGNSTSHGGGGIIYNAGLWNDVTDQSLGSYNGVGTNYFINVGTLEKTANTGTSTIDWTFNCPGGVLQTPSGFFTFNGNWGSNSVVNGTASVSGNLGGIIASNAAITWLGGDLEASLAVAQGGALTLSNTLNFAFHNYSLGTTNTGTLTNYGTVFWAGTIYGSGNATTHGGGGLIYNAGVWNAISDSPMGNYNGAGTNYFINAGTLQKTHGNGISTVGWNVTNPAGTIGSQTNTLTLGGVYDLSGGTVNVGINGIGNCGIVSLSGSPAVLAGKFNANLNNGYVPLTGSVFTALTYGSRSGVFTNFDLPFANAWQTNYGGTSFTLTVLNVRPVMGTLTNQTVDELTLLSQTATATDKDSGQTLTFGLVSPPSGMTINSSSGQIGWTPQQTQSPGTYPIYVSVTDNGTPSLSATNSFLATVREVNYPPSLPTIATQAVNELTLLTVNNAATNFNIHSTNSGYTLVNSPSNMVISTSGTITWTPAQTQSPSTNVITTIVTNGNPYDLINPNLTTTNQFTVIVKEVNVPPSPPTIATQTVNELTLLTVSNVATNFNIHSSIIGYSLLNPPSNMVINASGIVSWTPAQEQSPSTNLITAIVTNSNPYDTVNPRLASTNTFTVIVKEVNQAPVLSAISTQTATLLQMFTVTNVAAEPNIHSTNFGYRLISFPSGMTVNSSGVISWTPAANQSLSTNTVTTVVTNGNPYDTVNPHLTATNSFQVVVVPNSSATVLTNVVLNRTNLDLLWPADHTGWRLQVQTNVSGKGLGTNWQTFVGSTATNQEIVSAVSSNGSVFYRLVYP